jgi:hypothetical protein
MENQESPEQPQEQAVEQPQEQPVEQQQEQPVEQQQEQVVQEQGYKYSQNWFLMSEIKMNLSEYLGKSPETVNHILDIGSFEGVGSAFFADHFLDNENSTLTCVDPFLTIDNDYSEYLQNGQELNFDFNILNCKNSNKIIVKKITSDLFFENNTKTYNFIYIDGSRQIECIKRDMVKSLQYLENNGIMWMNNYNYNKEIYDAMNAFLETYEGQYDIIHNQYQLAIKKK